MPPDEPAPAEEGAPTTRCRILATATALFREIGYQKTTVADIARALKMSPANVYRFFDSKKAINEAVLKRLIGEIEALLAEIGDRPGGSAAARLAAAAEALHGASVRRMKEFPKVHEMVEAAMGESWDVCRHHVAGITGVFERVIRDGTERGEFDAPDPVLAAACFHAGLARYTHPLLVGQPTLAPVPPFPEMVAFLMRGLAPAGRGPGYSEAGLDGGAGSVAPGCGPS